MSWVNLDDVVTQLQLAGIEVDRGRLSFDARVQRWKVANEDNERRGWTRLKEWTSKSGHTYVVGSFGIWHGNDDGYTRIEMPKKDDNRPALTDEDKKAIRAAQKAAADQVKKIRDAEAKTAAMWAASVWNLCEPCAEHEYLTRKRIKPHGLRVLGEVSGDTIAALDDSNRYRLRDAAGALVVPMHDTNGNVCGLQFIYPTAHPRKKKIERDKEFWPTGMAMAETFGLICHLNRTGILLVTEGYATAASLHEATGLPTAYAYSANNLGKAGRALRKANPRLRLLFCADDDYLTPGNPGVTAAVNATAEIEHAAWIKPDFMEDGRDLRDGKKLTDFNDLAVLTGMPIRLANQVNAALDAHGWRDAVPAQRETPNGGAGKSGRPSAVSVMPVDDAVARFVPIDDGTGKHLFDYWTRRIALYDQMVRLLPAGTKSDDIKRHPVWLQRGSYYLDEVGFDPSEKDPSVKLNTWTGFEMQPVPGECKKLLETIYHLCKKEPNAQELVMWILRWMAYPLQHPGAKMGSALIFHGPQGTGKSLIFRVLAAIYGRYATVIGNSGIEDKFNADWSDSKCFILAEEIATNADKWNIKNELKELVTGETIRVRDMHIRAYHQKNHMNVVYLSNEDMPLPLENSDRRHLVIYTPPSLPEDHYIEVLNERDSGGIEAFYHFLLNLPLAGFGRHSRPPMTEAKADLIRLSLPSEQRFINDWTEGHTEYPLCPCLSMDLYAAYIRWCKVNGESRPRASHQFLGMVGHLPGWRSGLHRVHDDFACIGKTSPKRMVIPEEILLEKSGTAQPGDKTAANWLTESLHAFKKHAENASNWRDDA
jgi:putative DNA primase/helicase